MHPNVSFRWDAPDQMRAFIAQIGFGAVFAATPDGLRVAHVPVVMAGDDRLGFHLARGNALTRHLDGREALFCVTGPDAYISPDWYGVADQVPTWNYIAVELEGRVSRINDDALDQHLRSLTSAHEARLAPKPPWTPDQMSADRFTQQQRGIIGFELDIKAWRGTCKLSQNKPAEVRTAVADALDAQGMKAVAHLMRHFSGQ